MTGFMSFKLKICENINLYNYTMCRIFHRNYMVMIFQFKKYLTKKMLSSKLLLFPRQPGWRNNIMKMIDIYKKTELKWPKQNDRNETNLTT